nr:cryptochrome/photolyase family protein [Luminiphilus syltensis]
MARTHIGLKSGDPRKQGMSARNLILVLGDQLSLNNPALSDADPACDHILLAEVTEEATYVRHNRHKLVLLFSAMRHFASRLKRKGFEVHYFQLGDDVSTLKSACKTVLDGHDFERVLVCQPGEYRLAHEFRQWPEALGVEVEVLADTRFLASLEAFDAWADGRKQLRMEYFYRDMRRQYDILMDGDKPCGDRWNYDNENRVGWRQQEDIPPRVNVEPDAVTAAVIEEVSAAFPDNPGDLSQFRLAVTQTGAERQFDWFCEHALSRFGTYQDALVEESPWVFHSLISMYLNCGLLDPLEVCRRVEQHWRNGDCELSAAEGFIRQVLGWREYIRGIYWRFMPDYADENFFGAERPLPDWFWSGETEMRCVSQAVRQSLDLGYAHHIQRLMVIGNFSLLTGLDVQSVCDWYLAVYIDAYEWVELPNTLGMALYADGGSMASKPYAASGKYIQKQGDHCKQCRFKPSKMTGEDACPFNSLYWRFIDRQSDKLENNPRMGLIMANWKKRNPDDKTAILKWADHCLDRHA